MLFNSFEFLIFFPVVFFAFFLLPRRFQWMILLMASSYFYMAFVPWYVLVLFFLIIIDYSMGRLIESAQGEGRKIYLYFSIATNLGVLFLFKYLNFFNENITIFANAIGWNYSLESLQIILPIGLSFHVFQSLSYVIEVYRGKHPAEKHLGVYALYVMFFPQLVAGPIERPQHLLPQLHRVFEFEYERVADGLTQMLWGFFKKLVIADQLGVIVDGVYTDVDNMPPGVVVIAVVLFAYQLYCDFSGYSDIAIGSARVFGVELSANFMRPYSASSIAEFWRKWHISLSNWLRDYLYYPLALLNIGSPRIRVYVATLVTFILIGLWHGANWTFVLLGLTHGIYLSFAMVSKGIRNQIADVLRIAHFPRYHHWLKILTTFTLVSVSWVFFRAPTVQEAFEIIFTLPDGLVQLIGWTFSVNMTVVADALGIGGGFLVLRIASVVFLEGAQYIMRNHSSVRIYLMTLSKTARVLSYYFVCLWILLLGYFGEKTFIYFQF